MPIIDPTSPNNVQPLGDSGQLYTLSMSDEFNSASLDTTKWGLFTDFGDSRVPNTFDINVGNNSAIRIWANASYQRFTMSTVGKFYQSEGFFECRVRQCQGAGQFPSFWLYNTPENGNTFQPEIDIYECYGIPGANGWENGSNNPNNAAWTIWRDGGGHPGMSGTLKLSDAGMGGADLSAAYHTFGLKWTDTTMQFYFDGVAFGAAQPTPWTVAEMPRVYVLMDQWWGLGGTGPYVGQAATGSGNSMLVDYIRVWTIGGVSGTTFNAHVTQAPVDNATISGTVNLAISGNLIGSARLLPSVGASPVYGNFTLTADTSGVLAFDTTALANGTYPVRISAFTGASGTGTEAVAMTTRNWIINNTAGQLRYADRVRQATTSTGTGDMTVSGSLTGYQTIPSICTLGDHFFGAIEGVDVNNQPTGEWETGYFTYSNTNTISRTVTLASSNNNQAVNFSAGTKHIYFDVTSYELKSWIANQPAVGFGPFGQDASLYTLTFSDEFSSGFTIDTSKWNREIYYKTDNTVTNFDVSADNLRIWPAKNGTSFIERTINSAGKFQQQYGFFEIEAKLPVGQGLDIRFELFNNDEHTIRGMSAMPGATTGLWGNSNLHPIDSGLAVFTNFTLAAVDSRRLSSSVTVPDLSAGYHKYAIRWDATTIKYYFDGVQVGATVTHSTMNVPMYICLALWLAADDGAAVSGTGTLSTTNRYTPEGSANSFQINYVRAWSIN